MVERLAVLVERDYYWQGGSTRGEWWLLLHAVMILGRIASESAGLLLVRFMRRMSEAEDDDLEEWLAGDWPALFHNKPETVVPALRTLSEDRTLDWYRRTNAMDPLVALAERGGRESLDEALAWVARIAADEEENWELRLCCGNTLLDFPRPQHRPLLEDLAKRQGALGVHFTINDVRRAYFGAKDAPEWRDRDPWTFYSPPEIASPSGALGERGRRTSGRSANRRFRF